MTRRRQDGGFTLVELMISMVILSVVVPALALALLTVLRTTANVTQRYGDSQAQQQTATWFSADAQSAQTILGVGAADATDCLATAPGGGSVVLPFRWKDQTVSPQTTYVADYYLANSGGTTSLNRLLCSKQAGGFTAIQNIRLVDSVTSATPCGSSCSSTQAAPFLTVVIKSNLSPPAFTVKAYRRPA